MPFVKGQIANPSGRPKGEQNKLTQSAKEAFRYAFDKIGGSENLAKWARNNETDFYKLFSKLIPVDFTSGGEKIESGIRIEIVEAKKNENSSLPNI